MPANRYQQPTVTHTRCARNADSVTPNDSADLTNFAYFGLMASGAGVIKVDLVGGGTGILVPVVAGVVAPVQARRVYSTGTTATGIIALY